ncbi:alpha/beta hydrolase [Paraglaciecola chathamensis]|uniref:DUF676 domain-containing protein n=1 Tax=Paraglaciecola chathamensis TaxID=368405 RepID=A0A8H9I974_9ALTE|nr:alpha/beta hydrolase [Paraglaciecola oceanifecundans]GGZ58146.1 hypothetical protein GCM10011274_15100 [Paraglaciecola oceanifecundans]
MANGGEWFRKTESDTVVIFIHGLLSNTQKCWANTETGSFWPTLLAAKPDIQQIQRTPALADISIYTFEYLTTINSSNYSIQDAVELLSEYMIKLDYVIEKRGLIFVGHSMGGIVARKFITLNQRKLTNHKLGVFLVASPTLGSDYANWLSALARVLGHTQVNALRFSEKNEWLTTLDREFRSLHQNDDGLNISGKEVYEDVPVKIKGMQIPFMKPIVGEFSAASCFADALKIAGADHISISKPKNETDDVHRVLCSFIAEIICETPRRKQQPNVESNSESLENNKPKIIIEFDDLLTPSALSIDNMFGEFIGLASQHIHANLNSMERLMGNPKREDVFGAIQHANIRIIWPHEIYQLKKKMDELLNDFVHFKDKASRFYSADKPFIANQTRSLKSTAQSVHHLLEQYPKRLPYIWLGLIDYANCFPSPVNTMVSIATTNYLKFASFILYKKLALALNAVDRIDIPVSAPKKTLERILWQFSIDQFFTEPEEILRQYLVDIDGLELNAEIIIYGPKSEALRAYKESVTGEGIILGGWFSEWLIPQVELNLAEGSSCQQALYCEKAYIRKVTDLEGKDYGN